MYLAYFIKSNNNYIYQPNKIDMIIIIPHVLESRGIIIIL